VDLLFDDTNRTLFDVDINTIQNITTGSIAALPDGSDCNSFNTNIDVHPSTPIIDLSDFVPPFSIE